MASILKELKTLPEDEPPADQRWAVIQRVAACEQFSRAARLRDFLLYVGKQALIKGRDEIHEQEIGENVFGRSASYDRGSDNIVRVNATELRKRIESYFESAGADEPLIFEIPRGSYKPVFRYRHPESPRQPAVEAAGSTAETVPAEAVTVTRSRRPSQIAKVLWPAAVVVLVLLSVALYVRNRQLEQQLDPWKDKPAIALFWNGFLDPHRQTDLVLSDDSASVMEDITDKPLTLDDYLNRAYVQSIQSSGMSADRKQDVNQVLNHNLITFGAVRAVQVVLAAIPPAYPHYLTMARSFTADEINRDNVVLIGGKKSMLWDYLFEDQLNFITDYDYEHPHGFVRNRHPKAGEQSSYEAPSTPNSLISYTAVAYLPNPNRSGSVIILAGTDSDATGAAAAFLTSEEHMEQLLKVFKTDRFPYFEALLKTSRLSGTFFDAEVVAYRVYPR